MYVLFMIHKYKMYCFGKFCCVCLSNNSKFLNLSYIPVEDESNITFYEMLKLIKPELLQWNKYLPQIICPNCVKDLQIAYNFIQKLDKSFHNVSTYISLLKPPSKQRIRPSSKYKFKAAKKTNENNPRKKPLHTLIYNEETSRKIFFKIKKIQSKKQHKNANISSVNLSLRSNLSDISETFCDDSSISDSSTILLENYNADKNISLNYQNSLQNTITKLAKNLNLTDLNTLDALELNSNSDFDDSELDEYSWDIYDNEISYYDDFVKHEEAINLGSCDLSDITGNFSSCIKQESESKTTSVNTNNDLNLPQKTNLDDSLESWLHKIEDVTNIYDVSPLKINKNLKIISPIITSTPNNYIDSKLPEISKIFETNNSNNKEITKIDTYKSFLDITNNSSNNNNEIVVKQELIDYYEQHSLSRSQNTSTNYFEDQISINSSTEVISPLKTELEIVEHNLNYTQAELDFIKKEKLNNTTENSVLIDITESPVKKIKITSDTTENINNLNDRINTICSKINKQTETEKLTKTNVDISKNIISAALKAKELNEMLNYTNPETNSNVNDCKLKDNNITPKAPKTDFIVNKSAINNNNSLNISSDSDIEVIKVVNKPNDDMLENFDINDIVVLDELNNSIEESSESNRNVSESSETDGSHQCPYCTRSLKTLNGLTMHIHDKHKQKYNVCYYCDMNFDRHSSLLKHIAMHNRKSNETVTQPVLNDTKSKNGLLEIPTIPGDRKILLDTPHKTKNIEMERTARDTTPGLLDEPPFRDTKKPALLEIPKYRDNIPALLDSPRFRSSRSRNETMPAVLEIPRFRDSRARNETFPRVLDEIPNRFRFRGRGRDETLPSLQDDPRYRDFINEPRFRDWDDSGPDYLNEFRYRSWDERDYNRPRHDLRFHRHFRASLRGTNRWLPYGCRICKIGLESLYEFNKHIHDH